MRTILTGVAVVAFASLYGFLAFSRTTTLSGQLIDLACYSEDKTNTGNQHKGLGLNCARACALEGFPVGLLTADGKVYRVKGELAANSNAKLVPHMGEKVVLSGETEEGSELTITADSFR
jgi:hypothetical protein